MIYIMNKSALAKAQDSHKLAPQPQSSHSHFRRWLIVWIVIYTLIILVNLFQQEGAAITIIKLTGVLLCSVYSIRAFPKDYLLQLAMMTTFIADCFLACNNISIIGLMLFFVAQIVHLYRMSRPKKRPQVFLLALIGLFVMACTNLTDIIPSIYVIAAFYVFTLTANVLLSWHWQKHESHNPYAKAAFAGFILFACCDICTGISYLSLIGLFPAFLYIPANFAAWFFYYPSQVFVSNSSKLATPLSRASASAKNRNPSTI